MAELLDEFPALHPRDFRTPTHLGGLTFLELEVLSDWVADKAARRRRNSSRQAATAPARRARGKFGR